MEARAAAGSVRLRDLKGLHYLARLLAEPGRQFHALDVVAVARDGPGDAGLDAEPGLELASRSDAGELLDARAKEAYRQAVTRIRDHDPTLGEHLARAIRTGTYCTYLPDPRLPVAWKR